MVVAWSMDTPEYSRVKASFQHLGAQGTHVLHAYYTRNTWQPEHNRLLIVYNVLSDQSQAF